MILETLIARYPIMKKIDLYSGFELDANIVFREQAISDEIITEVELWYGYFDSIVRLIPIVEDPHPDSLIFQWYNHSGFFNHIEWECKRIEELYDQLRSVEEDIAVIDEEAYIALKQICISTMRNGNRLLIEYAC